MLYLIVNTDIVSKDTVQLEPPSAPSNDAEVQDARVFSISNAKTWLQHVGASLPLLDHNVLVAHFYLSERPGAAACSLYPTSRQLENQTVELPDNAQLVFSERTGDMALKNCTFKGRKIHTNILRGCVLCNGPEA